MKIYDRCPASVAERVQALVGKFHPELQVAEVTFDLLFVARDDEEESTKPVLTFHGVPALAIARIVPVKDRAKGCADAEILIDRDRFNDATPAQQDALLDHELQHFEAALKDGQFVLDDQHRPRLKMRPHDYDLGWFEVIARRHAEASVEVQQARLLHEQSGQSFFPFLESAFSHSKP